MRFISLAVLLFLPFTLHAAEILHPDPSSSDQPSPAVNPAKDKTVALLPSTISMTEMIVSVPHLRPYSRTNVIVEASEPPLSPTSHKITPDLIETTAGAFEDPSRYFQLLPGVVSDSDQRNDFLVRGGNPSENLFVIDNIDIHSINHLSLADTTGGFVSMIDNAAIQSMTLHTAAHDAKFEDRLSSVVEISTIPDQTPGTRAATRHMTEVGIAGVGGIDSRPLGNNGSLFISGRQGVLNLLTNDIGMNGVPKYTNNLIRADQTLANGDKVWGLALTGVDSIKIHPNPKDKEETAPFDIGYSGWRNTTGINWQHLFSARSFSVLTLSNSEQAQTVTTSAQRSANLSIYNEQTHDGDTTLKVEHTVQASSRVLLSGGGAETLHRIDYNIVQPDGVSNPYTLSSSTASATSIHRLFSTADDGVYGQAILTLPADIHLTVAAREQHWAFDHHVALTPKVSLSIPVGGSRIFSVGVADYAQLPSFLYLLSFAQNKTLAPIRSRQFTTALTLVDQSRVRLTLAAYRKNYRAYPVALNFPQLSMANIADTFGQAFLMFPMVSSGLGNAAGAELALDLRVSSRIMLAANVAYARSWYSGLDGVLRKGSFDLPLVANVATVIRAGKGVTFSARYSGTSGRPYTPDNLAESYAQNRDVYDLNQVNALRSSPYARVDFRLERATVMGAGTLLWHVGLDNALNRKNFYSYQWQPTIGGVAQQNQMPLFPDGGVKYTF